MLRKYVQQVKRPVAKSQNPLEKLQEALKYEGQEDQHQFAVELVAEIDDSISSIDGEISKDVRPGKTTGGKFGVQIVLPDNKRVSFASLASDVISKDSDLELVKPPSSRATKDFVFKHKDIKKNIYVQTRPDGQRGGGATADPNELMAAALCTLSKVPKVENIEDLDALIEQVKGIVKSGKVDGFTSLEVEALEQSYTNLCQAISAAEIVISRFGGGADKVYLTGKSWADDVKKFQVTKYGMQDYNASDFIIKKGNSFLGVSLKKKQSVTMADPTLINKSFTTLLKGKEFEGAVREIDKAAGKFYEQLIRNAYALQSIKPKVAVDKDGNAWLDKNMLKQLEGGRKGRINPRAFTKPDDWKKFVQNIPNELINYQLKKNRSFFKPLAAVIVKYSDMFGQQLTQLIFKMDLKDLQQLNFDFTLVTGVGRFLPTKGPIIEKGEYKDVDTMVGIMDTLLEKGKPTLVLDESKTQAYDKGATAAMLFMQLKIGNTPISDITLRYKGNFRAAPNFLATATKEFKALAKK